MTPSAIELETAALAEFAPLRRAERMLVRACRSGAIAKVGLRLPVAPSAEIGVRSSMLAFILRGGLAVRGRCVQLVGACVEGSLDLGNQTIPNSLWFYRCRFDSPVLLDSARVAGGVCFAGCHLPALLAEGCTIDADLELHAGTTIDEDLRLSRARIGGDLDCSRLDLSGGEDPTPSRRALLASGMRIGGDATFGKGFQALGEVKFTGARVQGDLRASGLFNGNPAAGGGRSPALRMDRIEVEGSVLLERGFGAAGCVSLRQSRIGGDLDATGASFDWQGDAAWVDGQSLVLDRARIDGALILRDLRTPLLRPSLLDARIGSLVDDTTTWGSQLALDGLRYGQFGDGAPLDATFRIDWLERQLPVHLGAQFRTQPWRRLIRVLRRMGHDHRAASVAIRRERWLRRIGWVESWAPSGLRWLPRSGHWALELLAGHGHRPARLLAWLATVWLACGAIYWAGAQFGVAPAPAPAEDLMLGALGHSLDRLLPLIDLGQSASWAAKSTWAEPIRLLGRAETAFGWAALLLWLASLAGWLDRDRRR